MVTITAMLLDAFTTFNPGDLYFGAFIIDVILITSIFD